MALLEMSKKGLGATIIIDEKGGVAGIFTDGDVRRALDKGVDINSAQVGAYMTGKCKTIHPEVLTAEALKMMDDYKINALPVVDDHNSLVGIINMHDLLRARVV
jgi:arabinose-5-phosphate isomerase